MVFNTYNQDTFFRSKSVRPFHSTIGYENTSSSERNFENKTKVYIYPKAKGHFDIVQLRCFVNVRTTGNLTAKLSGCQELWLSPN